MKVKYIDGVHQVPCTINFYASWHNIITSTGVTYENSTITRCVTRVPISCNYKPERLSLEIQSIFLEHLSSLLKMNSGLSGLTWGPKYIQYWRILLLIRNSSKCEWFQRCPPNINVVLKCTSTTVLFWWNQLVKNNQVRYRCPHQLQNQMPRWIGITFLKFSVYELIIVGLPWGSNYIQHQRILLPISWDSWKSFLESNS